MKNKNVKVIDEHNIDRNANVMFALELEGSEYAVYWIERDTESNNVFVSKVLKNIDGTYNMLNIDDSDKKEEISNIVKTLISTAVSDQNDKLVGTETTLSNGKVVKFVNVSFNKEQHINVQKTYITTVKKEVTMVAENYYDVVVETQVVEAPSVTPVVEPTPSVIEPITVAQPSVVVETPVIVSEPVSVVEPVLPSIPEPTVLEPVEAVQSTVVPESVLSTPIASPQPVISEPLKVETPVVEPTPVMPAASVIVPQVETPVVVSATVAAPMVETPATVTPVVEVPVQVAPTPIVVPEPVKQEPVAVIPTPVVPDPISEPINQPLVFDATKEKNLNAALGEVASTTNIPVENIEPVREFGVDTPVQQTVVQPQPAVAPIAQPAVDLEPKVLTKKAGFADSKFFMVVAVAFFLASCIFLGYEVFNYFQLIK